MARRQERSARRGIATEELVEVAKDEDVDLGFLIQRIANVSIIIPKNNVRKQNIKVVGIGHGLKTKVNVNRRSRHQRGPFHDS